ncbi:MAG: hypothetical protein RBU45_14820 [Myxococcota bacterium]|jgi:hypothetical protein|nr:hypothetical protein [Myxococcota bacterium]
MRRTLIVAILATGLLLGCSKGTPKYTAPPKNYPILYTFAAELDPVWDATLKALGELNIPVANADKAAGRIETGWAQTGWAPARRCKYGFVTYWESPVRQEKLTIEVKAAPLSAPPAYPPAQPTYPGYPPAAAPGYPPAQPTYPPAAPAYPGYPGSGGDVLAQVGFPPAVGAPAAPQMGTMVLVKSKGESILEEECGNEPKQVEITSDTTTEYKLLYTIGAKLGQRMEPPAQ